MNDVNIFRFKNNNKKNNIYKYILTIFMATYAVPSCYIGRLQATLFIESCAFDRMCICVVWRTKYDSIFGLVRPDFSKFNKNKQIEKVRKE